MNMSEKTCFANGKIFTASDTIREADAMTVENGRITWIGKKKRCHPGTGPWLTWKEEE